MNEDERKLCCVCELPTEIIVYIFRFLTAKQLIKCREVCARWKQIIDRLVRNDAIWRNYCRTDYSDNYKLARLKARPGMLWCDLYKSLSLWSQLANATELRDEFASASSVNEEIMDFTILCNGELGVHKRGAIVYYDIETLEHSKRGPITGDYLRYTENRDTILILSYHLQLFIIRKVINAPHFETNVTFDNVKTFILVEREVYFVNLDDEIHLCRLDDDDLSDIFLKRCDNAIMSLGYNENSLYILTFRRQIYTIINNNLIFVCTLDASSNLLHQLRKYNFLERLDWRVYIQWMYVLNHTVPNGPLRDVIVVRSYGDVVFVGSNWGVLRIYYAPYYCGELDLFNNEPVKQYNFMERCDCPVLSMCPIIQVDVLEAHNGHTVVVAMPRKIAVLNFVHNFSKASSVAVIPYNNIDELKILKINESA